MHFDPEGIHLTPPTWFYIILIHVRTRTRTQHSCRRTMANGILVLGGVGLLAVALVSVSLHKIEEGITRVLGSTIYVLADPHVTSSVSR